MLILLPPSEGKTVPSPGNQIFDDAKLSFPALNPPRERVRKALKKLSGSSEALTHLGLSQAQEGELKHNLSLDRSPAAPAHSVYSGVLYNALDYSAMTPTQRRKARDSLLVFSALWGVLGFADPIPAYRLSIAASLPQFGRLSSFWRPHITEALKERSTNSLIIDCRSSNYAASWTAPPEQTVKINVLQRRAGKLITVSHFAKHTRGHIARHLLTRSGRMPTNPAALLKAARERWDAELSDASGQTPYALSVILAETPKH